MENQEIKQINDNLFTALKKYPNNSKEYRETVTGIVKNNMGLVISIANEYFPSIKTTTISYDDLIQEGLIGVLNSIKLYQLEKGSFANYARKSIQNQIIKYLYRENRHQQPSLEDNKNEYGQQLKDDLTTLVNPEEDIAEKDETERQLTWVRKNLDKLSDLQRQVLIEKYLSGENITNDVLAERHECSKQNISNAKKSGIKALVAILHHESHPEEKEIKLTSEEKIAIKEILKNLITTKLAPQQKKVMLCRFYSASEKSNRQVAQELNSKGSNINGHILVATEKLCTLYNGIQNEKHLTNNAIKSILRFRTNENAKER